MPHQRSSEVLRDTSALTLGDEPLAGGVEDGAMQLPVRGPEVGIPLSYAFLIRRRYFLCLKSMGDRGVPRWVGRGLPEVEMGGKWTIRARLVKNSWSNGHSKMTINFAGCFHA